MASETNGSGKSRLDRIEENLERLANQQGQLQDDYRQLLRAQVLMHEAHTATHVVLDRFMGEITASQVRTDERIAAAEVRIAVAEEQMAAVEARLAAAQEHTEARLQALILVVDELIRRPPTAPQGA